MSVMMARTANTILAEPRPVLRGLRPSSRGAELEGEYHTSLQSRDPFSGDCDAEASAMASRTPRSNLQSRDPFSGDCDGDTNVPERHPSTKRLAELRPVLRGLRREIARPRLPNQNLASCRAETRSQGIATQSPENHRGTRQGNLLAEPRPVLRGLRPRPPPQGCAQALNRLAEPRPVLRGLRRSASGSGSISRNSILQSRDPFSGDCDPPGWRRSKP